MFLGTFKLLSLFIVIILSEAAEEREKRYSLMDQLDAQSGEAICRIPTRDLITTAQQTATRILQGVCNPRDLEQRFSSLESQIIDQFNVLKTMVLNVEDKLRDQDERVKNQHRKLQKAMIGSTRHQSDRRGNNRRGMMEGPENFNKNFLDNNSGRKYGRRSGRDFRRDPNRNFNHDSNSYSEHYDRDFIEGSDSDFIQDSGDDQRKMGDDHSDYVYYDGEQGDSNFDISGEDRDNGPSPRMDEISKYNSTIHTDEGKRAFTYYWRVKDMTYRSQNWGWRRSIRSDSFYIFKYGYMMYLRMYPNQEGKNVYIHVGLTQGEYDEALNWPFTLKHKIQILDHNHEPQDIMSRVWDPQELCSEWNWRKPDSRDNYECVGLGFPQSTLKYRNYMHDQAITVKLTVYLDKFSAGRPTLAHH